MKKDYDIKVNIFKKHKDKFIALVATVIAWWIVCMPLRSEAQTTNLQLATNGISITLDNTGRWGVNDGIAGQVGFTYNGTDLLKNTVTNRHEAGLMLGLSTTKVSDVVKTNTTTRNTDFIPQGNFGTGNSNGDFKEVVVAYKEAVSVANPLGIEVTQKMYGWNTTADQGFVIIEYRLKNTTNDTVRQLSVGVFADWNLGTFAENRADWDTNNNLGYIYETGGIGTHAGIALLTAQTPQYYAFDQDGTSGSMNINDGFGKAEKYQSMSSNLGRTQAGVSNNGNDVAHTVGARLISLAPGETNIVAFVLVAGANLGELQNRVQTATTRFKTLRSSPVPTLPADLKVCGPVGETTLTPTGGSNFRFYDQVPIVGTTTPIGEGATLRVQNIRANRTIYVTSTDSLFEGNYSSITVRHVYPTATIEDGLRTLCINGNLTLQANSTSQLGLSYQWQRNGQNIGGNTATLLINEAGIYTVTITKEGCRRTSTEAMVSQIAPPVITQSGAELSVASAGATTYQWFYNDLPLTGAVNATYIPRATGTYTVRVGFGNGCEITSAAFSLDITGLADFKKLEGIKIYPVPSTGSFTLKLPQNTKGFKVTIIDLSGSIRYFFTFLNGGKRAVQLPSSLPAGIYFLRVTSQNKQAILKLAIQR